MPAVLTNVIINIHFMKLMTTAFKGRRGNGTDL